MVEHHRNIVWQWLEEPGLEHLTIDETEKRILAASNVVSGFGGHAWHLRYQMICTPSWQFMSIDVEMKRPGEHRSLSLARSEDGLWSLDGQPRPDLADCIDSTSKPRLSPTLCPFTAWHLQSTKPGKSRSPIFAFLRSKFWQQVRNINGRIRQNPPRPFRFTSLSSRFTADLTADETGIVEDYPNLWRRLQ